MRSIWLAERQFPRHVFDPKRLLFLGVPAIAWAVFGLLLPPYLARRGIGDEFRAPHRLQAAEETLFFGQAPSRLLQQHVYAHDLAWLDFIAFLSHAGWFALPFAAGLAVTFLERDRLIEFQAWILVTCYLSTIAFALFPVQPPWMEAGIVRILTERSFIQYTGVDNNQVAAFPSLHAALPAVMTLFFALRCRRLRFVAWPCLAAALLIGLSVVYLGEHWVIDVLAGYALAALVAAVFVLPVLRRVYARIPGDPVARLSRFNHVLSTYDELERSERRTHLADLPKAA
jgi:membrane-associated phospholipid phosphatase